MEDWPIGCVKGLYNDLNLMFVTQALRIRNLYDDEFESEEKRNMINIPLFTVLQTAQYDIVVSWLSLCLFANAYNTLSQFMVII